MIYKNGDIVSITTDGKLEAFGIITQNNSYASDQYVSIKMLYAITITKSSWKKGEEYIIRGDDCSLVIKNTDKNNKENWRSILSLIILSE